MQQKKLVVGMVEKSIAAYCNEQASWKHATASG